MFKIGEFSQLVRVSPRMLRHYEKNGLFHPAEIDKINGYRLYSANQIPLLMRIIALRDMGFSINDIGDIIDRFEEKDYIQKVFQLKSDEIHEKINEEKNKIERLIYALDRADVGNYTMTCQEVVVKEIPKIKVLSLREVLPDYSYQELLWEKLYAFIGENELYPILEGKVITIYHSTEYKDQEVDVEAAVLVNMLGESQGEYIFKELEAIECAATVIGDGPFEKVLPEGEGMLARWIEDNDYEIKGSERTLCIKHPSNEPDPQKYISEIQFPIRKRVK